MSPFSSSTAGLSYGVSETGSDSNVTVMAVVLFRGVRARLESVRRGGLDPTRFNREKSYYLSKSLRPHEQGLMHPLMWCIHFGFACQNTYTDTQAKCWTYLCHWTRSSKSVSAHRWQNDCTWAPSSFAEGTCRWYGETILH